MTNSSEFPPSPQSDSWRWWWAGEQQDGRAANRWVLMHWDDDNHMWQRTRDRAAQSFAHGDRRGWHLEGFVYEGLILERLYIPDVPYVLVMASLAGFLGALTASFAKELGGALGKASAEAIVSAARRLSYHVRDKAHDGSLEFHATDHILRITHAGDLPEAAWRQLVELDFPQPPAEQLMELRWDSAAGRWRWHPRERRRRHSDS